MARSAPARPAQLGALHRHQACGERPDQIHRPGWPAFDITCSQIDIGNAATDMTAKASEGVPQADGSIRRSRAWIWRKQPAPSPTWPACRSSANVLFMTVMATKMPFVGRGYRALFRSDDFGQEPGAKCRSAVISRSRREIPMRACFLGQNVTALGFGVAMLQTQPLPEPEPQQKADAATEKRWPPEPAPPTRPRRHNTGVTPALLPANTVLDTRAGSEAVILFLLSYLGGVLTILSPCILPVLPFVFARADRPFLRSGPARCWPAWRSPSP